MASVSVDTIYSTASSSRCPRWPLTRTASATSRRLPKSSFCTVIRTATGHCSQLQSRCLTLRLNNKVARDFGSKVSRKESTSSARNVEACLCLKTTKWNGGRASHINSLNAELNPICYFLALLGAHHFLHVSRIGVKSLTFRRLMSYIYGAPILDVSRSHTTTQHSR